DRRGVRSRPSARADPQADPRRAHAQGDPHAGGRLAPAAPAALRRRDPDAHDLDARRRPVMRYPERNPFPHQGTASVEGSPLTLEAASLALCTLSLGPLERVRTLIEAYVARRGADQRGLGMLIHGEHGTGKTHALRYVMERIARAETNPELA